MSGIPNYRGSAIGQQSNGDVRVIEVYNNLGTTVSKGQPYILVPGWITAIGVVYVPLVLATNTAAHNLVGIPLADIADTKWGAFQVQGLCDYVLITGTVTANDRLQGINAGTGLIREGSGSDGLAIMTTDVCAISVEVVTAGSIWKCYLLGDQCSIAGS